MEAATIRGYRLRRAGWGSAFLPLLVVFVSAGCEEGPPDPPPPSGTDPAQVEEPPPPTEPQPPFFSPRGGPAGTEVEVWMDGLPAEASMMLGFGTVEGHEILTEMEVDVEGSISLTTEIPDRVDENRSYYFFVADETQQPLSVSDAFLVTDVDGRVEVSGRVTDEGMACVSVRGPEQELFSLEGDLPEMSEGDQVLLTGRISQEPECEEGIPIAVDEVSVAS